MRSSSNSHNNLEFIATKLEKHYPHITNYFAFANDDKALSQWYNGLSEVDMSLVILYLQFKMSDEVKQ